MVTLCLPFLYRFVLLVVASLLEQSSTRRQPWLKYFGFFVLLCFQTILNVNLLKFHSIFIYSSTKTIKIDNSFEQSIKFQLYDSNQAPAVMCHI